MLAWFAAFKARNVLVFLSLPSKTGAHRGYLLQATKVNLLAHAKKRHTSSGDFSVVIGEWK